MQGCHNLGEVGDWHGQGRHQDDDIAEGAQDHCVGAKPVADEVADSAAWIEGAAGGFVFDELDAGHEAFLADVADVREIFEWLEEFAELKGFLLD